MAENQFFLKNVQHWQNQKRFSPRRGATFVAFSCSNASGEQSRSIIFWLCSPKFVLFAVFANVTPLRGVFEPVQTKLKAVLASERRNVCSIFIKHYIRRAEPRNHFSALLAEVRLFVVFTNVAPLRGVLSLPKPNSKRFSPRRGATFVAFSCIITSGEQSRETIFRLLY